MGAGALSVSAYISHGVLSGKAVERVAASALKELVITDSILATDATRDCPRIRILTIAPLIGGSDDVIEKIKKQLNKLIEVVAVMDLSEGEHLEHELMLVKMRVVAEARGEIERVIGRFNGRIVDMAGKIYIIELTGAGSQLDSFLQAIDRSLILETVRTGASGIGRGDRILKL